MSPTTLVLPGAGAPRRVQLAWRDRSDGHAAAMASLHLSVALVVALQAVAVALAWPADVPAPWLAGAEAEAEGCAKRVKAAEAWLTACATKGTPDDVVAARRDLSARRTELAEARQRLDGARVVLTRDADALQAQAARVVAALEVPPFALYMAGRALLDAASAELFDGWQEYVELRDGGFSAPPEAAPSSGGSDSPTGGEATPSFG